MQAQSFSARSIRKYVAGLVLALSVLSCTPHASFAASSDDEDTAYDARVQGYDPDVELKSSSVGGTWVILIFCCALCVSVIFKDAKRSHLD